MFSGINEENSSEHLDLLKNKAQHILEVKNQINDLNNKRKKIHNENIKGKRRVFRTLSLIIGSVFFALSLFIPPLNIIWCASFLYLSDDLIGMHNKYFENGCTKFQIFKLKHSIRDKKHVEKELNKYGVSIYDLDKDKKENKVKNEEQFIYNNFNKVDKNINEISNKNLINENNYKKEFSIESHKPNKNNKNTYERVR